MTKPFWLVGLALLPAFAAIAAQSDTQKKTKVYRCQKDGVTVYSQIECAPDAKSVVVELDQGLPDKDYKAPYVKQQRQVDDYLAQKQQAEQLKRHYDNIARYKQQLAKAFDELKQRRFRSAQDKDDALKALSAKFNGLIKQEQDAIKAIHQAAKVKAKQAQPESAANNSDK